MLKSYLQYFAFLFLISFTCPTFSQVGEWTWLHGSDTASSPGSYGAQGVPSPSNAPPALYEANEWTDLNGNFWLYGGIQAGTSYRNDLWRYTPANNEWTWMKGPHTINDTAGSHGTRGVASPTNYPPGVAFGAATWTDYDGDLWLFGGYNNGFYFNDLWKYHISTNEWTWVKGPGITNQPGVYGTQGVPNPANIPSPRCEFSATWVTADTSGGAGNLWLFGGFHNVGGYNDLWRYNIATDTWTWMKGSTSQFQSGTYGTQGVEAPANTPGGRSAYSHWKDNSGNLWLFGGWIGSSSFTAFNDMWRYNPQTNNWAWMNGSTGNNAAGSYGTKCVTTATNHPGARLENRAVWTDANGNFWMFGGAMTALGGVSYRDFLNDLWMYCVATNQWTWMSGDTLANTAGNWGTIGISTPTNKPNGRAGAISWKDNAGHLYFFGGNAAGIVTFNDLWRFTIDPCCGTCSSNLPTAFFNSSDTAFCSEPLQCINFFDQSIGSPFSWQWIFTGASPDTSTSQNPTQICYSNPGTYPVTLIVTNCGGTDTLIISPMIYVGSTPPSPTIAVLGGDTLVCSPASGYQWFRDGNSIGGATDSFYVALQGGTYSVKITDSIGCSRLSGGVLITLASDFFFNTGIKLYPNPATEQVSLTGDFTAIDIYNVFGEKIFSRDISPSTLKHLPLVIDLSHFAAGVYFVTIQNGERKFNTKLIRQ